jgi:cephalosporin-C deacetylase-like acetyl esterase
MNELGSRRNKLRSWLDLRDPLPALDFEVFGRDVEPGYERVAIRYAGHDGDVVSAWLLLPQEVDKPVPGVVVHHQHNGQRHLGKSEVCGLVGDPLQAFGPVLAARGIVVIAADSICFEDRRANCQGTETHPDDRLQHYNEMAYRLLRGETLMRKVMEDAEAAVSVLAGIEIVDPLRIGVLGHSYGGNTTLFQAALDVRAQFACSSEIVFRSRRFFCLWKA